MPARSRDVEAASVAGLSIQPRLVLTEMEGAVKEGLMAFSCATGMVVIAEMMEAERARIVAWRLWPAWPGSRSRGLLDQRRIPSGHRLGFSVGRSRPVGGPPPPVRWVGRSTLGASGRAYR